MFWFCAILAVMEILLLQLLLLLTRVGLNDLLTARHAPMKPLSRVFLSSFLSSLSDTNCKFLFCMKC